ncbi:MAG: ABC transporter permease subunit [Pirellulales bacterium]
MAAGPEQSEIRARRQRRQRKSRKSVLIVDRLAQFLITIGGIGTIVAVSSVCVFLVLVVIPLFQSSHLTRDLDQPLSTAQASADRKVVVGGVDEYLTMAWLATDDGLLRTYRPESGEELAEVRLFDAEKELTACVYDPREDYLGLAFADSTIQLGKIDFTTRFVPLHDIPADLQDLPPGQRAAFQDGVMERTNEGQFRLQTLRVELDDPVELEGGAIAARLDVSISSSDTVVAMLTRDSELRVAKVRKRKNLLTGKETSTLTEGKLPVKLPEGKLPEYLKLAGLGDTVFLAWEDGWLQRFDTRRITAPVFAEELDLVEEPGERLTALEFLIGKTTLMSGDSLGRVRAWFRIKPEDAETVDGAVLVAAHDLPAGATEVKQLVASPRSRMLAAMFADGVIRLYHVTSNQQLADAEVAMGSGRAERLMIAPKDDAILAIGRDQLDSWRIDSPHPSATWSAIFGKVWYEGYNEPKHVWQSSSGTDDFEEKFGMMPLVFGTLKATFYSMLFGAPLAVLAAIYTSEFLHPRVRAKVKPTIEVMASLPSVVLGFLAALFFAPIIQDIVPESIAFLVALPFTYLLFAYLWQLFPEKLAVRMRNYRMVGMVVAFPAAILFAIWWGPIIQNWLFAGNIMAWLDGQIGTGTGAWMFILLPLSCVAVAFLSAAFFKPILRSVTESMGRQSFALLDLLRFLLNCLLILALAYAASWLLNAVGFDPRGTYIDTYVQRNALVVGLIMGFAIIPIIYTISDDALSAVPDSLRAASLGAGATRWQTTIRVIIPTAMSGLFSAMMIGLGRAVGETMIVLMAAGNTPVMDWNIFNGFRTLSANIAVELPEAVRDSTHYRMLFLAALALFVMTFLVNTVAEVIRLRFRKRAFQL